MLDLQEEFTCISANLLSLSFCALGTNVLTGGSVIDSDLPGCGDIGAEAG